MTSKSVESNSVSFFFTSKILLGKSDSKIWPKYPQNSHSGQNYSHKTHYIIYCYIPKCSGNPSRGLRAPAHSIWPNFVPSRIFSRCDPWYWTMILNCVECQLTKNNVNWYCLCKGRSERVNWYQLIWTFLFLCDQKRMCPYRIVLLWGTGDHELCSCSVL